MKHISYCADSLGQKIFRFYLPNGEQPRILKEESVTLTLFRMDLFWGCSQIGRGEGKNAPSLKSVTYITYTLPKEDPKNKLIT